MKQIIFLLSVALLIGFVACSEDDSGTNPNDNVPEDTSLFSLSGTIHNPNNIEIPDNVQLVVLWSVFMTSPDYIYKYGEGEIDLDAGTFSVKLNEYPPEAAYNILPPDSSEMKLGVGMILMFASDETIPEGKLGESIIENLYGVVNDRGIVYKEGELSGRNYWANDFEDGYSFAKGSYRDEEGVFDGWQIADKENVQLLITNSPEDFKFPNWF